MPSPFPGMDPYLEESGLWPDFHQRFITMLADALLPVLPDAYDARSEEQIRLVAVPPGTTHEFLPDVGVTRNVQADPPASGGTAVLDRPSLKPVILATPALVEERESWIEILHGEDRELVTVIEVLSPTNKAGSGWSKYRLKRRALRSHRVNLVEIDLLVGGKRVAEVVGPVPDSDLQIVVTRAAKLLARTGSCEVYPLMVRDPLPRLAVPLKPPTADVAVDLAEVFTTTYDRGRYAKVLRREDLPPDLRPADAAWARGIADAAASAKP